MKTIYKRIVGTIIAIAITIMMLPMSENVFATTQVTNWIDLADATWASGYTDNADTTAETFTISTAEELAQLAFKVNSGLSFTGKTIELTANIVLNSGTIDASSTDVKSWTAIGCSGSPTNKLFSGTFDGKDHTISGIYINSINAWQGLFGLSNGTIKNVGIINSYIKGAGNTGGFVGQNIGGTVTNCYNEGTIIGTGNSTGGIVGWSVSNGTVSNCYNTGAVSGTNMAGGVVGENEGSTISNCHNTGAVGSSTNVGGVAGINYGNNPVITNCYNTGAVIGNSDVGGVVGKNYGTNPTLSNSYNTGEVRGTITVGGVVGNNGIASSTIENSHNEGTVNGTGTNVGGVTGANSGTVSKSYNTGAVQGNSHWIGGVAGRNYNTIENCYNTGTVKGTSLTGNYIGGITGYSELLVKNSFNTGAVEGLGSFTGGIVGCNNSSSTIENCYNTGAVVGVIQTGGVVGYNQNIIINCYYYGCNVGFGGNEGSQAETTPFVKINDNPLGTSKTTTITEQTTADINTAWSNALGANFAVAFANNYTSSDTSKATVSGTLITGVSLGNSTISGRTMTITQNGLTATGFNGATETISVPISMPLSVTANGGGASIPTLTTNAATSIGTTTATLNGTVNANGASTIVRFSFGTTAGYGTTVTADQSPANGNTNTSVSCSISGLSPNTTYHYRVEAISFLGTNWGSDMTFTTGAITYDITYNLNDGTNHVDNLATYIEGTGLTLKNPTRMGYTFRGWFDNSAFTGTRITQISTTDTGNKVLYAKWIVNSSGEETIPSPTPLPEKEIIIKETPTSIKNKELIKVEEVGKAFTQSVEVRLKDDPDTKKVIEETMMKDFGSSSDKLTVFPLDISLYIKGTNTKVQPAAGTSVKITCPIPEELLTEKDSIKVVCIIDGKAVVLETKVVLINGVYCVEFTATHFSPYAFVVDKTNALSGIDSDTEDTDSNPKTGQSNAVVALSSIAILSVATLTVASRKRKVR